MKKYYLLALISTLLCMVGTARADVIKMNTLVAKGSTIRLALNAGITASLTWDDGTTETVTFSGQPVTLTVKSANLTIDSGSDPITTFYAPGDQIGALETSGAAGNLQQIFCSDNLLTILNLKGHTALKDLNVQNNRLVSLDVSPCLALQNLNCAGNQLTTFSTDVLQKLQSVICSDNAISDFALIRPFVLKTLWCQNNRISALSMPYAKVIQKIFASGNPTLSSVRFGSATTLTDLWMENDSLDTLDLSQFPSLASVSLSNNHLKLVNFNSNIYSTLKQIYLDHNALFFNSFPTVYNTSSKAYTVDDWSLTPQEDYILPFEQFTVNQITNLSDVFNNNAVGLAISPTVDWKTADGTALVKGTDYTSLSNRVKFMAEHKNGVYATLSTTRYPNVTLRTALIKVIDPNGIASAQTDGLRVSATRGLLTLSSASPRPVRIVTAGGVSVTEDKSFSGQQSWQLPAGVYIVNDVKVMVP